MATWCSAAASPSLESGGTTGGSLVPGCRPGPLPLPLLSFLPTPLWPPRPEPMPQAYGLTTTVAPTPTPPRPQDMLFFARSHGSGVGRHASEQKKMRRNPPPRSTPPPPLPSRMKQNFFGADVLCIPPGHGQGVSELFTLNVWMQTDCHELTRSYSAYRFCHKCIALSLPLHCEFFLTRSRVIQVEMISDAFSAKYV